MPPWAASFCRARKTWISRCSDAGDECRFRYDLQQRMTWTRDNLGRSTQRHWDEQYQVIWFKDETDAQGETTRYEHDEAGRLRQSQLPDGRVLTYARDRAGLLTGFTDAMGRRTRYLRNYLVGITSLPPGSYLVGKTGRGAGKLDDIQYPVPPAYLFTF